jgi:hypothetical protein
MAKKWVLEGKISNQFIMYVGLNTSIENSVVSFTANKDHAWTFSTQKEADEWKKTHRVNHLTSVRKEIDGKVRSEYLKAKIKEEQQHLKEAELYAKKLQVAQEKWDKMKEEEDLRIANLECPCCKSKGAEQIKIHAPVDYSRMVIGGPSRPPRPPLAEYYVCQECGVHFTDVKKKDLPPRP